MIIGKVKDYIWDWTNMATSFAPVFHIITIQKRMFLSVSMTQALFNVYGHLLEPVGTFIRVFFVDFIYIYVIWIMCVLMCVGLYVFMLLLSVFIINYPLNIT